MIDFSALTDEEIMLMYEKKMLPNEEFAPAYRRLHKIMESKVTKAKAEYVNLQVKRGRKESEPEEERR